MKEQIKKMFPGIYDMYCFEKYKQMDKKALSYYRTLPRSEFRKELERLYRDRVGHELDLDNPQRFTEKIQWRKLYELTPMMSRLSDKYEAREWVKEKIGEQYLIPLLGVWDTFDEIDFNKLPISFVLKTNNASGTNMIVNDKANFDRKMAKRKFDYWIKKPFGLLSGFELQYCDIKPKIIAEKNMLSEDIDDLPDYKFFCFDGKVYCSYTCIDFAKNQTIGRLAFFDRDYKIMPVHRSKDEYLPLYEQLEKPKNYHKMLEIAETLSKGFSHVRVDLYNVKGRIYFGEMTFTTHSGFAKFEPDDFDYVLGEQWNLPINKTNC